MKIVIKKQMSLLELIQGVWKGDVKAGERKSDYGNTVFIWSQGFETYKGVRIQDDELFTVEVEEELTEDTEFEELVFVYDDYAHRPLSGSMVHKSIHDILEYKSPIYKIYALVNRSLVLIWSSDHGIPSEGTLEI